jgi:hypothetical protein
MATAVGGGLWMQAVVDDGGYGGSNAGASRVGAATGRWRRQMVRRRRRKGSAPLGAPSAASLAPHGGVVSSELAAVGGEMAAVGGENGGGGEIVGAVRVNPNTPDGSPLPFAAGRMGRPTAPPCLPA